MTSEVVFQEQVVTLAKAYGWRAMHVRRTRGKGGGWTTSTSIVGWPDLFLYNPKQGRSLAVELKSDAGKLRPEQVDVLADLKASGVEVAVWRPADLDAANVILSPRCRVRAAVAPLVDEDPATKVRAVK